jgi:predicted RNA binding protein YcfA (HicA-like mRNA interferase family)
LPEKVRDVSKALKAKGFGEDVSKDHVYYFFFDKGKRTAINTKISHGETEISDHLFSSMAKQIKLTTGQFRNFVDCRLSREGYAAVLVEANHLSPQEETSKPLNTAKSKRDSS